jgi:hypothetical protein
MCDKGCVQQFLCDIIMLDAITEMAETPILSSDCVDALPSSRLKRTTMAVSTRLQVNFLGLRRFVVCNSLWVKPLRRTPYLLG